MRVKDKVVVVTGAGSGIGRAMSEKFVAEGARQLITVDINAENAQQTADKLGCVAMTADYDRWIKGMNRLHRSMTEIN